MIGSGVPALSGHRFLVVEDEELISLMLIDVLEEMGADVIGPAASVSDALVLVEQGGMTGALLDLSLRGETVYPVADKLAEMNVPYLFITGYGQGHLAARHADALVLTKPFGPDQLAAILARAAWTSSA